MKNTKEELLDFAFIDLAMMVWLSVRIGKDSKAWDDLLGELVKASRDDLAPHLSADELEALHVKYMEWFQKRTFSIQMIFEEGIAIDYKLVFIDEMEGDP